MRKWFSRSEIFFLVLGSVLVLASSIHLYRKLSIVAPETERHDPFSASYTAATPPPPISTPTPVATPAPVATPTPTPTPKAKPESTPKPKKGKKPHQSTSTPKPTPQQTTAKEKAYLLQPKAHAIFAKALSGKKPFTLLFKFEVEPKKTDCNLELLYQDKLVLNKKFKGSTTGSYELKIQLKKPGRYTWRIITSQSKSETREFIVKP